MTILSPLEQLLLALLMTVVSVGAYWWLILALNKSTGTSYAVAWKIISKDPLAVAVLRVGMYGAVAYLVGNSLSRFIG